VTKYLLLLSTFAVLAGCHEAVKPVPPATVVITGCQYFPRLTASKKDTDVTKEQILAYVSIWDRVCGPAKNP
jgi:hypothetical protein